MRDNHKDMELPFQEIEVNQNIVEREFFASTPSIEFMWHRDREDRTIVALHETDWKLQIDDKLPVNIDKDVFIPKGVYHRLIKGKGDLKIKVIKHIEE